MNIFVLLIGIALTMLIMYIVQRTVDRMNHNVVAMYDVPQNERTRIVTRNLWLGVIAPIVLVILLWWLLLQI